MKMNEKKEFKIDEDAIFERACERVGIRVSKAVEVVEVRDEVVGAGAGLGEKVIGGEEKGVGEKLDIKVEEAEIGGSDSR